MEGLKNVRKTYEWGGGLLEMYESVQGGSGEGVRGGSKIAKFERTFFMNDHLVSFWFLAICNNLSQFL